MARFDEQLTPCAYVASIYDIDLDKLWQRGKRFILTDLDNTLVPWNVAVLPESLTTWLAAAAAVGFQVCILSNNHGPRVEAFAKMSGIPAVANARKPKEVGFRQALARFHKTPAETVMIGDQLFTDIRGGNRCGLYTILVLPLHPVEWWGTRLVRKAERIAMKRLIRRGLQVPLRNQRD